MLFLLLLLLLFFPLNSAIPTPFAVYKLLSLCHGWYNCRVWNGGINISGTRLYQQAKVFVTASYRQFIVTAAGIHNATASCFLYGSAQKKTGGQGQQRRAFLLLQTQKSPKPQNFPSKTRQFPINISCKEIDALFLTLLSVYLFKIEKFQLVTFCNLISSARELSSNTVMPRLPY